MLGRVALGGLVAGLAVLVAMVRNAGGVDEFAYSLFPYISSTYFQAFGSYYVRAYTCHVLPALRRVGAVAPAVNCSSERGALYVIVTGAKGGTVLAARSAIEIAATCGWCGAIGLREHGRWPPCQESMPTFKGDVLLAIANAQAWPTYAREHGGTVRCAVFTRDPATRFKSLFQYALDGSEYDLREPASALRALLPDYDKALAAMWESMGQETMRESHRVLMQSLAHPGCVQIKYEVFERDFDAAAEQWARAWHIRPDALGAVVRSVQRHDVKRKSPEALAREHHLSGTKLSAEDKRRMEAALAAHAEVQTVIAAQRRDLGY